MSNSGDFPAWGQNARQRNGAASSNVGMSAGGDLYVGDGSQVAGRDAISTTTTINNKRNFQIGLGLAVLVAAIGIPLTVNSLSSSSKSIVYTAGEQGAVGTVQQMQQAEETGDASSWCFLASAGDSGTCQSLLSNGFSTSASAAIRSKVADITVGQPSGSGETYTFNLVYKGRNYPVAFEWTGQRWQLSDTAYDLSVNNGGLFASVIETADGTGAIFGVPIG